MTPPSTADDTQFHDYATLDDFQPTVSQWPPKEPQEYSDPVNAPVNRGKIRTSGVPNVYNEPMLPGENRAVQPQEYSDPVNVPVNGGKIRTSGLANVYNEPMHPGEKRAVGKDGIVTDRQGYAMLDPVARSYEGPMTNGAQKNVAEGISSLPVPQSYETPFETSFGSLYEDASSTNVSRSTTPVNMRRESPEGNDTNLATNHTLSEKEACSTHNYATLESPK